MERGVEHMCVAVLSELLYSILGNVGGHEMWRKCNEKHLTSFKDLVNNLLRTTKLPHFNPH